MARPLPFYRPGVPLARGNVILPPELPSPAAPQLTAEADAAQLIVCPSCDNLAALADGSCPHCGFPFSCDITARDPAPQRRQLTTWRYVLSALALLFILTGGLFSRTSEDAYRGASLDTLAQLQPDTASTVPLNGPPGFVARTQLALGLLKSRAPEYYRRLEANVARIDYFSPEELNSPEGRKVHMEGIGALSTPETRRVQVLPLTVFPDGEGVSDYSLFNYAATLVHELRHIELHWSQQAPGGWQEEVLCEQSALDFLQEAGAPPGLIGDKQAYLDDPTNKRYQAWYDWYKQFK